MTTAIYRRLSIFGELWQADFMVDVVDEPRAADVAPEMFEILTSKPVFLFVRARNMMMRVIAANTGRHLDWRVTIPIVLRRATMSSPRSAAFSRRSCAFSQRTRLSASVATASLTSAEASDVR